MAYLSRRDFIVSSATTLGTACVGSLPTLALAEPIQAGIDPYAGFKMGIQTYTLRQFNLDQALAHIASLGL